MLLNEQITQLRKQKKMSQEELAAALQVSRQAVSKWENGSTAPDYTVFGQSHLDMAWRDTPI